ncbi:hypothetical protein [Streptomyces sp. S.PB5]|uniref:hypothetical protein n=1 Tax=Streptomyces sp. S.PB5 TaxID=3020844 RepID=UPI0025B105A8|nr:hypothetical protein [Streptomyces sp. S.PB5]MDN3025559.1 hypothetical protein [Streptomyces sp. S.PB5]
MAIDAGAALLAFVIPSFIPRARPAVAAGTPDDGPAGDSPAEATDDTAAET